MMEQHIPTKRDDHKQLSVLPYLSSVPGAVIKANEEG